MDNIGSVKSRLLRVGWQRRSSCGFSLRTAFNASKKLPSSLDLIALTNPPNHPPEAGTSSLGVHLLTGTPDHMSEADDSLMPIMRIGPLGTVMTGRSMLGLMEWKRFWRRCLSGLRSSNSLACRSKSATSSYRADNLAKFDAYH
jgi:hypothetical protein